MISSNDPIQSADSPTVRRDETAGRRVSRTLQRRLQALQQERDELAARLAEWDDRRPYLDSLADEHADLSQWRQENEPRLAELEDLRGRAALPADEAQRRLVELQGRWRQKVHEEAFRDAVANVRGEDGKAYTLHPDARLETLWREIGYEPDSDEPDPKRVGEAARQALKAMPYAFQEASGTPDEANGTAQPRTMPPGPGAVRGTPEAETDDLTVSPAQLRDPVFMHGLQKRLERDPRARERFRIRPA